MRNKETRTFVNSIKDLSRLSKNITQQITAETKINLLEDKAKAKGFNCQVKKPPRLKKFYYSIRISHYSNKRTVLTHGIYKMMPNVFYDPNIQTHKFPLFYVLMNQTPFTTIHIYLNHCSIL
ncbi:hypothetical protein HZS_4481 [Henneguya salminicola]|nr:hypothetical protein HZS_4481 [Henneguya salminicola]